MASLMPLRGVKSWEATIERATGRRPTRRQRCLLVENWLRNMLWSVSLARWSDEEVMSVIDVSAEDEAKLHASLAGPGLVAALPHMGSWDFAGAWAARVGIRVVSVAERLPDGLFERFRDARKGMGMTIHAVDQPELMRVLTDDIRARRLVCLLSDRDLSSRGIRVSWPEAGEVGVPAGPALLANRTGADLRVVTTGFHGSRLRLEVSDPIPGADTEAMMRSVVEHFAAAVRRSPENWIMLRRLFQ